MPAVAMAFGPWRMPWRIAAVLCGLLIAWSRVALGVHFPSDILAGWAAAVAWVVLAYLLVFRGGRPWDGSFNAR